MKKRLLLLFVFFATLVASAQGGFNYKAIIYDNGNPIQNQSVNVKFTILDGTAIIYEETQTTPSDNNGIIILSIGNGTPLGPVNFDNLDWTSSYTFLKVEIDTGSGYQDMGTTAFKYVPYAKVADTAHQADYAVYADNADMANSAGYADNATYAATAGNVPTNISQLVNDSGYLTSEVDGDTTNELQTLAISGNTLSISDGNSVTLPSSSGGADNDFLVVGTGAVPNNNSDNIYHEGSISIGHDGASNAKVHVRNIDSDIDDYENTGIYVQNNNTSTTDKIGVQLTMEAPTTNNTAIIYGVKSNIVDRGDSNIYGEHTTIGGLNGDGDHIGNYIALTSDGYGIHTGTKVNMLTGAQGVLIGNDIEINTIQATNASTLYGVKTKITGLATGTKYAVSNTLNGDAEGYLFGVKNEISNTANGKHYGVYNKMSGTGTNSHYGSYTKISGSGSGTQIGYTTNNYNSGNGIHYGAHNFIYGSGSGEHIGVKNELSGAGTGNQIGVRNMINNTNGTNQYGVYTTLDATSGNGDRFATRNDLFGAGDGNLYGVRNQVANSGAGVHTGTYNNIYGSGNGTHYGTRNALSGSGTGVQYGNHTVVNNPNNNTHYGSYIEMSGTGDGDKYGVYAKTNHSTSGTEYAIYGEVDSATSYAGYFKGKVTIEGKVTSTSLETDDIVLNNKITTTIGGTDHNMIAHIFGYISEYGDRINQACSNGFTSARIATGRYRITTPISMIYSNAYIVTATIDGNEGIIWVSDRTSTSFVINIKNGFTTTDWLNSDFNFVVYKK
jgi:hypothetical protein